MSETTNLGLKHEAIHLLNSFHRHHYPVLSECQCGL
jgi:hypothetical protein